MKISPVRVDLFHAGRRTHMTDLIVAFRNFANAPKNGKHCSKLGVAVQSHITDGSLRPSELPEGTQFLFRPYTKTTTAKLPYTVPGGLRLRGDQLQESDECYADHTGWARSHRTPRP